MIREIAANRPALIPEDSLRRLGTRGGDEISGVDALPGSESDPALGAK